MSIDPIDILTLYRWELRSALRDRTIVVNSIILPLVLYPAILWAIFNGIAFVRGQTNDLMSRVAVVAASATSDDLLRRFERDERVQLVTGIPDQQALQRALRAHDLDAGVLVSPAADGTSAPPKIRLLFDGSRERSEAARRRVEAIVDDYRGSWLRRDAESRGVTSDKWYAFGIERQDAASSAEIGSFLLGLMLPLFFVIMVALGCLNPAIDSTAGERERGTWETLMTTGTARTNIVVAKYLVVLTLGGMAGLLNVVAMLLTMRGVVAPLMDQGDAPLEFGISLSAIPLIVLSAILLAGILAAGMMVLAAFARTFREGQSMVAPFYLATVAPVTLLSAPGIELTRTLALVPVVNLALVTREAIAGRFKTAETAIAVLISVCAIILLLKIAERVLAAEDVLAGSFSGSFGTFVRTRWLGRTSKHTHAPGAV